jgi:hypothetical protein
MTNMQIDYNESAAVMGKFSVLIFRKEANLSKYKASMS